MLIVSKFHDFYDTASIYGVDKTCVYLRSQEKVEIKRKSWDSDYVVKLPTGDNFLLKRIHGGLGNTYRTNTLGEMQIERRVIAFCGQFYPVIRVYPRLGVGKSFCFYNAEEFTQFAQRENLFRNRFRYSYYSSRWNRYDVDTEQGVKAFFDTTSIRGYEVLFHAFRTPVFIFGSDQSLILNPNLKEYGFMKIKDPQTAFQDIYMYLSGVLGAPPPPREKMSDKVLAAAKGHDGEYSFKKPPGKRGKKQWR